MPDPEIDAMSAVAEALGGLDDDARARVLRWAAERYGIADLGARGRGQVEGLGRGGGDDEQDAGDASTDESEGEDNYEHFADIYDAVAPTTDPERVLVAAFWVQEILGKAPFGSQELNKLLKDLGHGVGTINKAMSSNMSKKPALVLQVSRGGSSQQARKKYKLTEAGVRAIRDRLS